MNDLQISFTKMDTGWGVRVYDPAPGGNRHLGLAGQTVEVRKRDGSTKSVRLGQMLYQGNGDKGYYEVATDKPEFDASTPRVPRIGDPLSLSEAELRTVLGALSVTIGETDGSPADWDLLQRIQRHLGVEVWGRPDYVPAAA